MAKRFTESLYRTYGQSFVIDEVLFETRTDHQHLIIFNNDEFGRVMTLDGVVQTTERDEFIYHEMLTHVPILAHGAIKKVLIVGGGDGGILREVLRHSTLESVVMVEIDAAVVELCSKYFPDHSAGAFADPRLTLVIDDGFDYVAKCSEKFDLIISDSTDPEGPGEVLFSHEFYRACRKLLNKKGIFVSQSGVNFLQLPELIETRQRLQGLYQDCWFYGAAVPTYVGGTMTFAWATDDLSLRSVPESLIQQRFSAANFKTRYYTPAMHCASFALPQFVLDEFSK